MRRSPLIAGIVAVLGLLVFWVLVLAPRGAERERLRAEISTAQGELNSLSAQLASLSSVDVQALQAELSGYRGKIPATADEPGIIQALLDAAREANVTFDGVQFGAPSASAAQAVSVINLSFTAKGKYFDLARFLFELEHLDRLSYVRSVSLARTEGGLTLSLAVDMYTTDTSSGPGSDPAPGPEVGGA